MFWQYESYNGHDRTGIQMLYYIAHTIRLQQKYTYAYQLLRLPCNQSFW